jgi:hypothetical protein
MVHVYFKGSGVLVFEPKDERKVGESCLLLILFSPFFLLLSFTFCTHQ